MSKNIEKKFNKLIKNSNPQELENKLAYHTNEAIDDVLLNGNKNNGLEKMRTTVKFFQDHKHNHPINFRNASNKIISHLVERLSKTLENTILSNQELKLFINLMGIVDLMTLDYVTDLINNYQEEKNESYLENAKYIINEIKKMKITMLNDESFPEAIARINEITSDHPELNETHEKFIKDIKKDIKDQNLNKKNSSKKV